MGEATAVAIEPDPLIFISYRRADTKALVSELARTLALNFGPNSVFVDTDKIRAGVRWKDEIESALERATLLLIAIGEDWLSISDEFQKRRIDDKDDWVHREIRYALDTSKPIIPVRFDAPITFLSERALPDDLARLADIHSIEIRQSDWQHDVVGVLNRLEDFGFKNSKPAVHYPDPVVKEPVATESEINEFLRRHPDWQVQYRPHPTDPSRQRRGIGTTLVFRDFSDAIHFMNTASWGIQERNHHPEWENVWKSVTIWITQFDIDGDITARNIELAEYLMSVYGPYAKVAT